MKIAIKSATVKEINLEFPRYYKYESNYLCGNDDISETYFYELLHKTEIDKFFKIELYKCESVWECKIDKDYDFAELFMEDFSIFSCSMRSLYESIDRHEFEKVFCEFLEFTK